MSQSNAGDPERRLCISVTYIKGATKQFLKNAFGHSVGPNPKTYLLSSKGCLVIYIYEFSRRFYPKRIQAIYIYFISMCVPWELNPQPFALLTQCSTTEPQEHMIERRSSPDTRISTIDEMEDIHL